MEAANTGTHFIRVFRHGNGNPVPVKWGSDFVFGIFVFGILVFVVQQQVRGKLAPS